MQSNAQTAPRTGAQKSQKDDGGLRCTGAASSGRKFQVPSTSTTASTSTSRSGSGSGSRSPKLRRCAPAKKAEKSARKIRVASLCLCTFV
uniref:HDC07860 n=1 Tax=Drosophila melanogaster TaxID=7227 RepID=Q6IM09_DROME|nr:TPA_inf: HDC07860 [Drosophila melanogaster]